MPDRNKQFDPSYKRYADALAQLRPLNVGENYIKKQVVKAIKTPSEMVLADLLEIVPTPALKYLQTMLGGEIVNVHGILIFDTTRTQAPGEIITDSEQSS